MRRDILLGRDVVAGALFIAFGAATVVYAQRYEMGSLTEMGSGYFPVILGGILMLAGIGIASASLLLRDDRPIPRPEFRALAAICASVISFSLLLNIVGLAASVFVTIIVARMARPGFLRPRVLGLAIFLAVLCSVVFVQLLGVALPVLPPAWQDF